MVFSLDKMGKTLRNKKLRFYTFLAQLWELYHFNSSNGDQPFLLNKDVGISSYQMLKIRSIPKEGKESFIELSSGEVIGKSDFKFKILELS